MKKYITSLFVISFLFAGCSKDDDDDKNCDLNNTNIVGVYKTTAVTYKATPSSPEEDDFSTWAPCEKDDLIVFNDNGTGNLQDAGVKCAPPGDDTFTWSLTGNILTIDGFIASTVTSFDCSTMKITLTDPSNDDQIKQPYYSVKDQPERIRTYRNEVRQAVDYSVLFFIAFWGLNVMDAAVDAHLKSFDVSDELSLGIKAGYSPLANTNGVSLVLHIGK